MTKDNPPRSWSQPRLSAWLSRSFSWCPLGYTLSLGRPALSLCCKDFTKGKGQILVAPGQVTEHLWISISEFWWWATRYPPPLHITDTLHSHLPSPHFPQCGSSRIQAFSLNILTLLIYQISLEVNSIDPEDRQVLVSNPSSSIKLGIWPWKNYLISTLSFPVYKINIMIVSTYWRFNELNTTQWFAQCQA